MEQIRVENGVNIHRCEQGCKQGPKWWEEMTPDCVRGESEGSREQEIQKAQCVPGNGRIAGRQRALHNGDNSWQERRILDGLNVTRLAQNAVTMTGPERGACQIIHARIIT